MPLLLSLEWKNNCLDIEVFYEKGFPYVVYKDRRLFFPKAWSRAWIKLSVTSLLMEQDDDSPHRYFPRKMKISDDAWFIDIGGAEGIATLEVIDSVKKAIIIEGDKEWVEPLKLTFRPWKEKVSLIN